jgi:hypothetical protein
VKVLDILVSAKHLILASPAFKGMLRKGNFLEGNMMRSSSQVTICLPDEDPAIFTILLDIVHGHVRQVPKSIKLDELVGLAMVYDKYELQEICELHVKSWLPELKKDLPMTFGPTVLPWMTASWVFFLVEEFQHVTKLAEIESCVPLGEDED